MKKILLIFSIFFWVVLGFGQADLQVINTNSQTGYVLNSSAVYTVTVSNNGPNNATNVHVVNPIPSGITQFSWSGNAATGTNIPLNNTILVLNVGASVTYSITLFVPSNFVGDLINAATVSSDTVDPTPLCPQCTDTDVAVSDLRVLNSDSQTGYQLGEISEYTVSVLNQGPNNAVNVHFTNPIPAGISNFTWTASNGTYGSSGINNTFPVLKSGQNIVYTIRVLVPTTFVNNLINTASVTSSTLDPTLADNQSSDIDVASADIEVVNSNGQNIYVANTTTVYTLAITNNGPNNATAIHVAYAIPALIPASNFYWIGSNGTSGTGVPISDNIATLANGSTVYYYITVVIPAGITQPLITQAVVTTPTFDPQTACSRCIDKDVITGADIVVTNTDFSKTFNLGDKKIYKLTVENKGPEDANNVKVVNNIPPGIYDFRWVSSELPQGVGQINAPINDTITKLRVGKIREYIVTLKVPTSFSGGFLLNEASAIATNVDPDETCAFCKDTDILAVGANIVVKNTNNQAYYTPGTTVIYTVDVTNNGPEHAYNVKVLNEIPVGITQFSWTCSNGATGFNTKINNSILQLNVGQSVTYTITLQVPLLYSGHLINETKVTSDTVDPFPDCLMCIDDDAPIQGSDIQVTNTDNTATYLTGSTKNYTVTVKNNGPEVATNIHVTVPLSNGISIMGWSGNSTSGLNALDNTIVSLAVGASIVYNVQISVPNNYVGDLKTEANAVANQVDLYPDCSQCIDIDVLKPVADLVVTNTDNIVNYSLGGTSVYTVTVTNNGPQDATNVIVSNTVPTGISVFSWTASNGMSGNSAISDLTPLLQNGQSVVYTITIQVPASFTGNLVNSASAVSQTFDPDTSCANCVDVNTYLLATDIVVTNTNNQDNYTPGSNVTYTITVQNNGFENAINVVVQNPIPTGITQFSWSGSNGSSGNSTLNNTIPVLAVGQTITYTITLNVPIGFTGNLIDQVVFSSDTPDSNPICSQCKDTDYPTFGASLEVITTDNTVQYLPGSTAIYIVTVKNNSSIAAQNIVVASTIPVGISQYSWTGSNGSSGTNALYNTILVLNNNETITYTITIQIPICKSGNLEVKATINAEIWNPLTSITSSTDINTRAGIEIVNSDGFNNFIPGQTRTYALTVKNLGPVLASNLAVQNLLPAGIPFSNMTWSGNNSIGTGDLNNTIASLAVGATVIYTIVIKIPSDFAQNSNLVNTVSFSSLQYNSSLCSNLTDIDVPTAYADIKASISDNDENFILSYHAIPANSIMSTPISENIKIKTYNLTVTNYGPSDALNFQVSSDAIYTKTAPAIPAGGQNLLIPITAINWQGNGKTGEGAFADTVGILKAGETVSYAISVTMPFGPNYPALQFPNLHPSSEYKPFTIANTVSVFSTTTDPNPLCTTCTDIDKYNFKISNVDKPSNYVTIDPILDIPANPPANPISAMPYTYNVKQLVTDILINSHCLPINPPETTAAISHSTKIGLGYFKRNNADFPFEEGIMLRSGIAENSEGHYADGPNLSSESVPGDVADADLQPYMGAGSNRDASFIKFHFKPLGSTFSFNYLFSANEYGQFQCDWYDVFAFILTDLTTGLKQNLAVLNDNSRVSIATIRDVAFNGGCPSVHADLFEKYNVNDLPYSPISMRGFTKPLTAKAVNLVPGREYSIKLVIGDYNDHLYDSAVFIQAGSFDFGDPNITGTGIYAGETNFDICEGKTTRIEAATAANPSVAYSWTKNGIPIPGANQYYLDVTDQGLYTVTFSYIGSVAGCTASDSINLKFLDPAPKSYETPSDMYICTGGISTFNLLEKPAEIVAGQNINDFTFTFYHSQQDADNLINPITTNLNAYPGLENEPIFIAIEYAGAITDCLPTKKFLLHFTPSPSGTFEYPNGVSGLCRNSSVAFAKTDLTPLVSGGIYTVEPTIGLIIDELTGELDLTNAIPGTYTINYNLAAAAGCAAFLTSTSVLIKPCMITNMDEIPAICVGNAVTLTTSDAGAGVTYNWSEATLGNIGTTTVPTFVLPTQLTAGNFNYSVYASLGALVTSTSTKPLVVNPYPVAALSGPTSPPCIGSNASILFTGTPNATVIYTDNAGSHTIQLNSLGSYSLDLTALTTANTFQIVSMTGGTAPFCISSVNLINPPVSSTYSLTLSPLPTATIAQNIAAICEGNNTSIAISGTAGASVVYSINSVVQTTPIVLDTAGNGSISTGNLAALSGNYTYKIENITTAGTNPCTQIITNQTTLVTVVPTPTVSFSAQSAGICSNATATFDFVGTPLANVIFNDGTTNQNIQLTASGTYTYVTAPLTANTTFQLISVAANTSPICLQNIPATTPNATILISVGLPTASIAQNINPICSGASTIIDVTGTPNAIVSFMVNSVLSTTTINLDATGNGTITTGILMTLAGNYTYEITSVVTSGTSPCTTNISGQQTLVTVNPSPSATIAQNIAAICEGNATSIAISGTAGASVVYSINNVVQTTPIVLDAAGNGTISTGNLVTLTGNYTYKIENITTAGANGCTQIITNQTTLITVIGTPTATIGTSNNTVCYGAAATLSFSGTPLATVTFTDGTTNFSINLDSTGNFDTTTANLNTNTTYTILTIDSNTTPPCIATIPAGTASAILAITVVQPSATIGLSSIGICSGTSTLLTVTGTANATVAYTIDGANSTTIALDASGVGTIDTGVLNYNSVTNLVYKLENITTTGSLICTQPIINQQTTVTVNPLPSVAFSAQFATICSGATNIINFVGTPYATVVFWDGTSNQTIVLDNFGKFAYTTLALTADTTFQLISVAANTNPSCLQTLTGTANSAEPVQVVIPVATIDKSDAQICSGSNSLLTVLGSPNATVVYSINGSNMTTLVLDSFGNGVIDTGILSSNLPVIYTYKLETVAIGGVFPCIKNIIGEIKTVTVMPLPTVSIQTGTNTVICEGAKSDIIFKGTPNAIVVYTINGGTNKNITLNSSGDYIFSTGILKTNTTYQLVSVSTNNLPTCTLFLTNSVSIVVNKIPNPNLDQEGYICVDAISGITLKTYSLDTGLSTTEYDFQWYGPSGIIVGANQNQYNATEIGTFYVIITNKITGCSRKDTAKIIQSSPPKSISADVVSNYFDENATIILTALPAGGDYEYAIDFGQYQSSNVFTGVSLGTHELHARDTKACDEASPVFVKVIGYPKFFTPNGDGINDYWNISTLNFQSNAKIYIFDRSGKLLKQISSTGQGWDGNFLGNPAPADDYWFTIEYLENNENKIFKAHFTLKR